MRREAPLDIVHLAAHCRNVPVTFTLDVTMSLRSAFVLALLLAGSATAQTRQLGPDVYLSTGYFLMKRLDLRCPAPDSLRAAALERFQAHYLEGVEELVAVTKPSDPDALSRLQRAATQGLSSEQNAKLDAFLDRFTPVKIAQLCAEARSNIDQIIAQERRSRTDFRKQHRGTAE